MPIVISHSNDHEPGTWKVLETTDGKKASFVCPNCEELGSLAGHTIAADGAVTPSVVCSYMCGFHEFIRLNEWNG